MQRERLADPRDHVRLRDRLAAADRQRGVVVGAVAQRLGDEELARHAFHRGEHALVRDVAATQLPLDHPLRGGSGGTRQRSHVRRRLDAEVLQDARGATSTIDCGCASIPIVSIGTSESPRASEPWLPPPGVMAAGEVGELDTRAPPRRARRRRSGC